MIDDASAMVLLLAEGKAHTSRDATKYLNMLDLSTGRDLYEYCMDICPYYDTVIQGRKKAVLDMCTHTLTEGSITQAAIFGAGMDALSIELVSRHGDVHVFELDCVGMQYKRSLIDSACKEVGRRISCISSKMHSPGGTASALEEHGWKRSEPTLLVFEGISYYVPGSLLFGIISLFGSRRHRNYAVLEYLVNESLISERRRAVPNAVFRRIAHRRGIKISRYDGASIRNGLKASGGKVLETRDLTRMERDLDGKNTHFKKGGTGWIEVCRIAI